MRYNTQYEKDPTDLITHAVAQSAVNIVHEIDAKCIVSFSVSGNTPKKISKKTPTITGIRVYAQQRDLQPPLPAMGHHPHGISRKSMMSSA